MSPKEKPQGEKHQFSIKMTRRRFLQGVAGVGFWAAYGGGFDLVTKVAPATNQAEEDARQQYPRPPLNQVRDAQKVVAQSKQNPQEVSSGELLSAQDIMQKETANRQEAGRLLEERGINSRLIRDLEFIGAGILAVVASRIFYKERSL